MTSNLPPCLAAIDLGTNTFRLVTRGLQMVEYPRIGHGVDKSGRIAAASFWRGIAAIAKFARVVRKRRLKVVGVVGTSALREASNGPAFCETIRRRFGWDVQIISGDEEATLTFLGATASLALASGRVSASGAPSAGVPDAGRVSASGAPSAGVPDAGKTVLVSDVGGGSTELIWGRAGKIRGRVSLKLGSVRMTERYRTSGRSRPRKIATLRSAVRTILNSAKAPWGKIETVVGVGGTATTLAAILHGVEPYDEKQVHGAAVPLDSMEKMIDVLSIMTPRERVYLPSVPQGRADIIVAGTVIQTEITRLAGADRIIASDAGILTGLILRAKNPLARHAQKV